MIRKVELAANLNMTKTLVKSKPRAKSAALMQRKCKVPKTRRMPKIVHQGIVGVNGRRGIMSEQQQRGLGPYNLRHRRAAIMSTWSAEAVVAQKTPLDRHFQ